MRKELLNLLLCPTCSSTKFDFAVEDENSVEVRRGKATCINCKSEYTVKNGVIDFLLNPRIDVISEQKGWLYLAKQNGSYKQEIIEQLAAKLPDINSLCNPVFREHWLPHVTNFNSALKILNLKGSEKILDIGAGRCWTTKTFAKFGCQAIAFDILSDNVLGLGAADNMISEKLYFERTIGDMEKLPFRSESFDVVFSTASIHHSDIHKSISEASRILKSGGRLVLINEPTVSANDERLTKLECEEVKVGIAEHIYSIADYCSATENAGIEPNLYYPSGALFMIKLILRKPLGQPYLRKTKLLASALFKARIANSKTLPLIWHLNKLKPYFGLFLIGLKT